MEDVIGIEDVSGVQKRISISVSSESVDKKFNDFFENIRKDAEIKGFRKGKAPVKILKQQFKDRAKDVVSQMITSEFYNKAIKDYNLNPLSAPKLENPSSGYGTFNQDNSYSISLLIDVLPVIVPTGHTNMSLDYPDYNVQSVVESKILEYRNQFSERKQINDRPVKNNDDVVIDFVGFLDGEKFAGGSASGFSLQKIGSGTFVPGFEEQIIGMNIGDSKNINVIFPDNYHASNLAGKEAMFEVKLHAIVETTPAELNEELAMMLGFSSVDELTNKINSDATKDVNDSTRTKLEEQIVNNLLKVNKFDVPKSMVDFEYKRLMDSNKNLPKHMEEQVKVMAELNVKKAIILDAIYESESSLEITPDEMDKQLEQYSALHGLSKDELVSNLYNSKQMDAFVGTLKAKKAIDFIINNSNKN